MNGSIKQVDFAKSIIAGLKTWAQDKISEPQADQDNLRAALAQQTNKELARQLLSELAVINLIEQGDMDSAEAAFQGVQRTDLLMSIFDGQSISAARLIDTYKKTFYDFVIAN